MAEGVVEEVGGTVGIKEIMEGRCLVEEAATNRLWILFPSAVAHGLELEGISSRCQKPLASKNDKTASSGHAEIVA